MCNVCGLERDDDQEQCEHCGNHASSYCPSQDDIAAGCEQIQREWSELVEGNRRRGGIGREPPLEVPVIARHPRGRRVRRERFD